MRRDRAVGAHGDFHAGVDGAAERLAVDVDDLVRLVDRGLRQCDAGLGGGDDSARREERRDEPRPSLDHQVDGLVVEVDAVVDRADAGADRVLDPVGRLRVRHHEDAGSVGLLDEHLELS